MGFQVEPILVYGWVGTPETVFEAIKNFVKMPDASCSNAGFFENTCEFNDGCCPRQICENYFDKLTENYKKAIKKLKIPENRYDSYHINFVRSYDFMDEDRYYLGIEVKRISNLSSEDFTKLQSQMQNILNEVMGDVEYIPAKFHTLLHGH